MRNKRARRNDDDRSRPRDRIRRPLSPRRAQSPSSYDRPPPRSDTWRPRAGDQDDRSGQYSHRNDDYRSLDSYRPPVPRGDFTFRFNKPAGIPDLQPNGHLNENRAPRRDRFGPPRKPGRRWQPPPHPSERALISGAMLNLPEERVDPGDGGAKFRDLDEISDDDELEMDISSASESEEPSRKRARTNITCEDANSVPKWSNPDPYSVMPCPDESRKKRDVVKLIRKARVEAATKADASTEAEDFLSFDITEDEEEEEGDDNDDDRTEISRPHSEPQRPLPTSVPASFTHKHPDDRNKRNGLPAPDHSGPLGSRKRTADDEIKPPDYGQLKKASMKPSKGSVTSTWLPKKNEDPCPWQTQDHSATHNMAFRLHKEIIDFYDYVRPRAFEQRIRDNLVENLRKAMRRDGRNFASAQVHPFGSFMSGLYLPTADMDLVVCSASYMRGGPPTYLGAKSWLYKFQKFLVTQKVADSDSIEVIAHARIPLVKFVDKLTGLKVDVSFENLGGVTAVDTFLSWKKQYPAMPILVTVIKHFLLMRGLNEPVNGGIGGFSVICLVVSMLQMMPHVQSRSLVPEHHLGEMLLEFFELYGRQFQYETNAISLTRPIGYIRKSEVATFTYRNRDRLSIIDPNNSSNDISGGSSNTNSIMARFEDAYYALRDRMKEIALNPRTGGILDAILEGDYSSFRLQREYIRHVHEQNIGPCSD
ncbi:topoisomerase family protein TRF4 [Metarhizium album ARSEF 1941]|uniref:polynucleotide adenylyltransferase n=1 Tax=Metarhizium album (strain ARSEF 1941) TaxID=1081103 RepID=A0A0B2WZB1_METAS|nr:topoisomerase family protein TRF4 [Metarhizium album ARSEF 1941]KHO01637.1 topoisomerase family protein TRF4 [Metarhizium album ARSEF 1941]